MSSLVAAAGCRGLAWLMKTLAVTSPEPGVPNGQSIFRGRAAGDAVERAV